MILSYSERIGHNTWTPWKKYDTFYPPLEHTPPPQRQTSEDDIYQSHQLIFNQPQTQDRVNKIVENIRSKTGVANISFTNSGWSATVTLYNPTPQNLINEIRNDPCMDQLKPTITIQPAPNFIPTQQQNLAPGVRENLTNENDERNIVEDQSTESVNSQPEQNDTNVIDKVLNSQNISEEVHTPEESQATLDENSEENPPEENQQEQIPPEDILNSPKRNQENDDKSGKKAQ